MRDRGARGRYRDRQQRRTPRTSTRVKKAEVTGGTAGIGLATVKALLEEGALGYPTLSVFSGSRAAVRSFARVLAADLLPRKIRLNAVSPGFIRTPTMGIHGASEGEVAAVVKEGEEITPMKRIGSLDEIARAALLLGFDATFTTGAELPVHGGLSQL